MAELIKALNKSEYDTRHEDALIKVGGSDKLLEGKFVPNINSTKWNDECWININHPDVVGNEKEVLENGVAELTIGNNTHRFYNLPDGRLEYEVVFAARPLTNEVSLDLQFSEGMEFYKQLTLEEEYLVYQDYKDQTLKDFLSSNHRPDDKINSISAWHPKQGNQYKTGLFCRFFRPTFTDDNGDMIWGDQFIDPITKKWTIIGDQNWLESAVYPVILGPTLGYDGQDLSTEHGGTSGNIRCVKATTDGTGGDIDSFHATIKQIDSVAANREIKMCVAELDGGSPSTPKSQDMLEQVTMSSLTVNDDFNVSALGTTALSASTEYAVCFINKDQDNKLTFEAKAGWKSVARASLTYASEFQDPMDSGEWVEADPRTWGVWVTYTAVGGGATILTGFKNTNIFRHMIGR
jgi:hypothetical protein